MVKIDIPGKEGLIFNKIVLDFNGTIAIGGELIDGVLEKLEYLSSRLEIFIVTGDTFGNVRSALSKYPFLNVKIITANEQAKQKLDFLRQLDPSNCIAIGNGRNDLLMIREAALGIGIIGADGMYAKLCAESDILFYSITDALNIFDNTKSLIAILRG